MLRANELLPILYTGGNWSTEKLDNMLKFTKIVSFSVGSEPAFAIASAASFTEQPYLLLSN